MLQETAERTSTIGPGDDTRPYPGDDGFSDMAPPLPQILNPRAWADRGSNRHKWRWLRPWRSSGSRKMSSIRLALLIGALTLAVLGAVNGLLGTQAETGLALIKAGLSDVTSAASLPGSLVRPAKAVAARDESIEAREPTIPEALSSPSSSPSNAQSAAASQVTMTVDPQDTAIRRAAELIAAGQIPAAREQLTRAAAMGNAAARFALAETYDPNMLAAWGRLEPVADVRIARALYKQALAGGDTRAQRRIDALTGGN
ncbi:MAG: hypothetical protein AB7G35_00810 [Hyphomicrobiaceae bacterium]